MTEIPVRTTTPRANRGCHWRWWSWPSSGWCSLAMSCACCYGRRFVIAVPASDGMGSNSTAACWTASGSSCWVGRGRRGWRRSWWRPGCGHTRWPRSGPGRCPPRSSCSSGTGRWRGWGANRQQTGPRTPALSWPASFGTRSVKWGD